MSEKKKHPTLNDQQFSLQMQGVSDIYAKMQIELFDSMIKRLKKRGAADLQENPYVWQLEKLNDMHMLNDKNLKTISERTGIAENLLRDVIANEGLRVYKDTKQQLEEDLGRVHSGIVRNGVTDALEAYTSQAIEDLNLINTTLPKSIQSVFKSIVEQTVANVVAGTKTSDRALHETIMSWQKKALPVLQIQQVGSGELIVMHALSSKQRLTEYITKCALDQRRNWELIHFTTLSNAQRAQHAAQFRVK